MSEQSVEIVMRFQPRPDMDMAQLFRDDDLWAATRSVIARSFHPDYECVFRGLPNDDGKTYPGLDGLRAFWLEWMSPWATYRAEIEQAMDLGDRVLVLTSDFGRREDSAREARLTGASLYTVLAGTVVRSEHYPSRAEALKAVGLED